jgi:hypothetical protein
VAVFPQGLSHVDARCNPGERRVLQQLKRCLEDDYLVWHDIPIGPRARQPDFVILSPRWGVLLLEVKDWRRATLAAATRDVVELDTARGRVAHAHPLRQARDCMMELVDLMQADPALVHAGGAFAGRLLFPYGWGVVFSGVRRDEVQGSDWDEVFPAARTLLRDDLDPALDAAALQRRLWGMFTVHYPHTLTLPQRDRVRWHLFPDVRLSTQLPLALGEDGGAAPVLPDLLQVMDLQQEQVARTLGEGHRVVHGAAGSGKTMILVFRAQFLAQAARPERPILVMCFNRTLATRIEALLRQRGVDERVQVRTFHSWCQDMVRSYHLSVPPDLPRDEHYAALAHAVARAVDAGRVPGGQYSALLIDEAHDFQDDWLRMAARMVVPDKANLLVLYDDAQSIYQTRRRKFNFASVGIEARGRTSILRLNYRNTAEVLALAVHCAHELLEAGSTVRGEDEPQLVPPASAGRRGPLPVLLRARHAQEEAAWLAERIVQAQRDGVALNDLAVLCRTRTQMTPIERALRQHGVAVQSMGAQAFRRFDWGEPSVKLLTLHSAKGLEFRCVFVAGLQAMPVRDEALEAATRLLYVAMTRATHELVLSAHGDSPLVQRVAASLQAVAQQFAAAA